MHDPLFDVAGKTVVITGGLGRLGSGFARTLIGRGAKVAVVDAASRGKGKAPAGREAWMHVACDVTDRAELKTALKKIQKEMGVPHGLVNAAAIDAPPGADASENGPFEDYSEKSWDRVTDVNLKGVFLSCQVFGGAMAEAGRGSVVNIGSIYGIVSPDQRVYDYRKKSGEAFFKPAVYSATKSALLNLSRYLATYWAPRGVRVNTVTFGGVQDGQDARFVRAYSERTPLGRMAKPGEYDASLVYLLSDASSYMTGSNLVIDGGWTAW